MVHAITQAVMLGVNNLLVMKKVISSESKLRLIKERIVSLSNQETGSLAGGHSVVSTRGACVPSPDCIINVLTFQPQPQNTSIVFCQ